MQRRVDRLEDNTGERRKAVIVIEVGETEEAATERHFAEHPDERGARDPMFVQLVDPTAAQAAADCEN